MRITRSKYAVSTIIAVLIAILLISSVMTAFLFILQEQGRSVQSGVKTHLQTSEVAREQLDAILEAESEDGLIIKVKNTGLVTARVVQLLAVKSDGSLNSVNIEPESFMSLEEKTINVPYSGEYERLGLFTERGNVFPVKTYEICETYKLTIFVVPSETGTTDPAPGEHWYDEGSSVIVAATPNSGYEFDYWVLDGVVHPENPITVVMDGSHSLEAHFKHFKESTPNTATVIFSASGLGSDADNEYVLKVDGTSYRKNQLPMSFTWDVGSPHSFEWLTPVSAGSGKRYVWYKTEGLSDKRSGTITVPVSDGSVTATYKTQYSLTIQVSPSGAGSTNPSSGEHWYDSDSPPVSVEATANLGYAFDYWMLDGIKKTENPTSVSMNTYHTLEAHFTGASYTLTVYVKKDGTSTGIQGVTVKIDESPYTADYYGKVRALATYGSHTVKIDSPYYPSSGTRYVFTKWSDRSTSNPRTVSVTSSTTLTAYMKLQYRVTLQTSGLGNDFSGYSVTFDRKGYRVFDIYVNPTYEPGTKEVWVDADRTVNYEWVSPIESTTSGKRYLITSTQSGSVTVTSPKTVSANYKTQYRLRVNVSPSGSGSVYLNPPKKTTTGGDFWYDPGTSVSAKATANSGYVFDYWLLDGAKKTGNPIPVSMSAPHTLEAYFKGASYALTVYVKKDGTNNGIQGVTVKIDGFPYTTDSNGKVSVSVTYGTHTVEIVSPYSPSSGTRYVFTKWNDGKTTNPRSYSVANDKTITAYMKTQYYLDVNSPYDSPTGEGWYNAGSTASSSVSSPVSGGSGKRYVCTGYTGTGSAPSGSGTSVSFTINAPSSITWNWKTQYYLTMEVSPSGSGTVSPGSGWRNAGSSVTISATPASGYSFDHWTGSGSGSYSGTSRTASITMNGPITETAYFKSRPQTYTVTFTRTGLPSGTGWSVTFGRTTESSSGSSIKFYNVEAGSYSWSVSTPISGGSGIRYVASPSSGIMNVPSQTSQTITYTKQYKLTIQVTPSDGGTTNPAPGGHWYNSGSSVSVKATPYASYVFDHWVLDGNNAGMSNPITVSMNSAHTLKASFKRDIVTVTFSASSLKSATNDKNVLYVDGTYYKGWDLPKTFAWVVGSKHSYFWCDYIYTDESTYISDNDVRYKWTKCTGITSSRSGSITVPSNGGYVRAYYDRYVEVVVLTPDPSSEAGSVSPGSGYHKEGTSFTATANYGYKFHHWDINSGASTSYSKTYYAWNPCKLKAVFHIRVRVYVEDYEGYSISNVRVSLAGQTKYTDSYYGRAEFYVPYGSHSLSIPYTVDAFGYNVHFLKWSDGSTSRSRTVSIYEPTFYTAKYKTPLKITSADVQIILGAPTHYHAFGYVKSVYGSPVSGANVKVTLHIYNGLEWFTRTATSTTEYDGRYNCHAYGYDYVARIWAEATASKYGYENAYWRSSERRGRTYMVTFTQTGLPSGKQWSVTFDENTKYSTGSSISFTDVEAGSYSWSVSTVYDDPAKYVPSPSSGTMSVSSDTTKSITYTKKYYLTMKVSPSGSGTVSPGSGWKKAGFSVTISASPNSGYDFDRWSGSGSGSYSGTDSSATITMNGPITETTYFEEKVTTHTVRFYQYSLPSGKSWAVTFNGESKSSTSSSIYFYNVPEDSHYYSVGYVYSGSGTRYKPSPSSGYITVSGYTSKYISFTKQYYLTMRRSPSYGGSVSPSSGWKNAGSSVSISASPASGYRFDRWVGSGSGSYSGTSRTRTITMNGPITETAYFEKQSSTYTVRFYRTGVPSGASWWAKLGSSKKSSTSSTISFYNVEAGTYSWSVESVIEYNGRYYVVTGGYSGTISVPGTTSITKKYVEVY